MIMKKFNYLVEMEETRLKAVSLSFMQSRTAFVQIFVTKVSEQLCLGRVCSSDKL